ncbi:hypothetical protein COX95_03385 [bacterium CG_4_10_14_0_2_um_filter_33_32]|nr:MAG: hypothetical protein COU50_02845 [bacterium CG10_big_fil_rev_8_21_14_0_10_33_18]PIU77055.1 MAG: hypothetical protein COS74_00840 [bacterium CG06_land_8_20_14_3_00_33_50]PIW81402.1 MAG: hypothetical protein COZ97_02060 [bacterium CG_4_8_14_3_um_filter_33_28]PIY85329.1 MAG: hypothetical protein COY76_02675 [bacterium CG_4_10_14_0_8_um_filter_33_57]PIZ85608.1 MAG: hypothetical protein COX95_03385 [bacterium CG_4_10_14_0_2_um_filter_33_32]PJA71916.1 MAG: hypothetical protein CO152_04165 [b
MFEARVRILLVDDDQLMTRMYERKFKFEGLDIVIKYNGKEALDLLKKDNKFDVILLDIMMPEMNGFEFLEARGKIKNIANIPVLLLTNLSMSNGNDEQKAYKLGAVGFMVKSRLQPNDVVEAVRKCKKEHSK